MTSTGQKDLTINPRERALSVDVNRLQAFKDQAQAEALLYLQEGTTTLDTDGLGHLAYPLSVAATPPQATIIGGLQPVPSDGTFNIQVTGGLCAFYAPDVPANPDDSPYKFISDPGSLVLTFAANAGPGTRVDVLECQPVDAVLETDNRDIFDPSSGLFAPQSVNKVQAKRLTYRIRQGVLGNGYPGSVAGWLPLAVIAIPAAAANLDTCDIWDCRPLSQGRIFPPGKAVQFNHNLDRQALGIDTLSAAPARLIRGFSESDSAFGYKTGGHIRTGNYSSSAAYVDSFDVTNVNNQEPGFAPVVGALWYLYTIGKPFGLPRFAKYTQAPGRFPSNPEGILVISNKAPNAFSGLGVNIALPVSLGLGPLNQVGLCLLAGVGYNPGGGVVPGIASTRGKQHILEGDFFVPCGAPLTPVDALGNSFRTYTLAPGVTHPPHAKSVIIFFTVNFTSPGPTASIPVFNTVRLFDPTLAETKFEWVDPKTVSVTDGANNGFLMMTMEVPVFPGEPLAVRHLFGIDPLLATVTSTTALVKGWTFLVNPG